MSIHTFGDSHCVNGYTFTFNQDNKPLSYYRDVTSHHLGPTLCYTVGMRGTDILNISHHGIKDGDSVVFCFGEIDCRCHVHKHVNENTTYETIIDNIVEKYFQTVNANKSLFNNLIVYIYNVLPPIQRHNTEEDPFYPFVGNDEERKSYVLYFNKKLKEMCKIHNFIFIDIYDKCIDENGFLDKKISDNRVHIDTGIYLNEFFNSL
jgi:hypothetical protein